MYAVLKGEDFLCFERFETRKAGERWLEDEIRWYNLAYTSPDINEVMTDKEFRVRFPDDENCIKSIRLGAKLTALIDER